jgi:hypothetical protein
VLFYTLEANGALDMKSIHSSCPMKVLLIDCTRHSTPYSYTTIHAYSTIHAYTIIHSSCPLNPLLFVRCSEA